MNRQLCITFLVLALASAATADSPKDRWLGDVDSALVAARKENKPVFLVFR